MKKKNTQQKPEIGLETFSLQSFMCEYSTTVQPETPLIVIVSGVLTKKKEEIERLYKKKKQTKNKLTYGCVKTRTVQA